MLLKFLPVKMRLPLKFGAETVDSIQIAHVEIDAYGTTGTGETPLSVAWAWPSDLSFAFRERAMMDFCRMLEREYRPSGHDPMTEGYAFLMEKLPEIHARFNREYAVDMPHLAALICTSAFDIALHDAFGKSRHLPAFRTYHAGFMEHDLAWFYDDPAFRGKYPQDYFVRDVPEHLPVWHLVGGRDLLLESERTHRPEFRFDSIYQHVHFVPLNEFGASLLRLLTIQNWNNRLMDLLFDADVRSYGRGTLEYDAYIDGK